MSSKRDDDEFESSDELDEFEASTENKKAKAGTAVVKNRPHDEEFELSQDLSVAESYDGRTSKEMKMKNDKYDEAVELSQSMDPSSSQKQQLRQLGNEQKHAEDPKPSGSGGGSGGTLHRTNSQSVTNRHFDEALEISQSGSDESVDSNLRQNNKVAAMDKQVGEDARKKLAANVTTPSTTGSQKKRDDVHIAQMPTKQTAPNKAGEGKRDDNDDESSEEEGDDDKDSAGNETTIEGQYNPDDFAGLNVSSEVKDLFQYITRFKPQDIDLDTQLKCFIPEYIPAIGEMDSFLKVPRPDGQSDYLGLKCLDEPAAIQSDPTVLELQLRAVSKKQQYGDVVVRSIENAAKNPVAIDKWVNNINDLHRSKPPPQVHYKRNMPDIEKLMEAWPPEFEELLKTTQLPSPDLDLSLVEYAKVLCAILDIPTYENPIESLHLMFSLYMDFKNNPHFQGQNAANYDQNGGGYGDADVMHINQGFK